MYINTEYLSTLDWDGPWATAQAEPLRGGMLPGIRQRLGFDSCLYDVGQSKADLWARKAARRISTMPVIQRRNLLGARNLFLSKWGKES